MAQDPDRHCTALTARPSQLYSSHNTVAAATSSELESWLVIQSETHWSFRPTPAYNSKLRDIKIKCYFSYLMKFGPKDKEKSKECIKKLILKTQRVGWR